MDDGITLKGAVANLDEVPESHRALYTQQGEQFILTEIKIENLQGLKNATDAMRAERNEAREKLAIADVQLLETNAKLHTAVLVRDTRDALVAAGVTELGLKLLSDVLLKSLKLVDGEPRVFDVDGKVRMTGDRPMTVRELAGEYQSDDQYSGVFKALGMGGTGSDPTAGSGRAAGAGHKSIQRDAFAKLSPQAQLAHVKAGGKVAD